MYSFVVNSANVSVPRVVGILDTWLLVAAFSNAKREDGARDTLDALADLRSLLVPGPVLVEAWGWIAGKHKEIAAGQAMLEWVFDPTTRVAVLPDDPEQHLNVKRTRETTGVELDLVDAYVIHSYHKLVGGMGKNSDVYIVSADLRDLMRFVHRDRRPIRVLDPRDTSETTLEPP